MPDAIRKSSRKRKSPASSSSSGPDDVVKAQRGKAEPLLPHREEGDDGEGVIEFDASLIPERNQYGDLVFKDFPEFRPNLTPEEVLRLGSFGGTYFRPIHSSVAGRNFTTAEALRGLPKEWFSGLDMAKMVSSKTYRPQVNKYKVKCGQGLTEWESSGWITAHDPYGWFQWHCRFYLGRRCADDLRQVKRGTGVMGESGRWKRYLANKILQAAGSGGSKAREAALHDYSISPKVRQLLQHWGYAITAEALHAAKKLKK